MIDPGAKLAAAQRAALETSAELAAAMGQAIPLVFDVAPTNQAPPYVLIGEVQIDDDPDACLEGSEIFATVHHWSRPEPPSAGQGRAMAAAIRSVLAPVLAIEGHEVIVAEFESSRLFPDPDGSTHGVMTFRYLTTPAT